MDNDRKIIAIKEKKEKIDKIKTKYQNMNMSDKDAQKIRRLEITNTILKSATLLVGITTAIDLVVPDMLPGVDEALLASLTTLLGVGVSIVDNKIESIAKNSDSSIKMDEINRLSQGLNGVASSVAKRKKC